MAHGARNYGFFKDLVAVVIQLRRHFEAFERFYNFGCYMKRKHKTKFLLYFTSNILDSHYHGSFHINDTYIRSCHVCVCVWFFFLRVGYTGFIKKKNLCENKVIEDESLCSKIKTN